MQSFNGRQVLRLLPVEKNWGTGFLRLGPQLESNLSHGSSYLLRTGYLRTWLNIAGGTGLRWAGTRWRRQHQRLFVRGYALSCGLACWCKQVLGQKRLYAARVGEFVFRFVPAVAFAIKHQPFRLLARCPQGLAHL